jgi:hypothetical protein
LEAIRFRTDLGLQADLPFVRSVAAHPLASSDDFGVPLLPAEVKELMDRSTNADALRAIVDLEADAHPEDYCGRYVDNDNGGAFTSMWRANLAIHEAAIRLNASPFAELAFVPCSFSEAQLDELTDRLFGLQNAQWMAEIPAIATGWGPNVVANRVEIDVSSRAPDAAIRIRQHLEAELQLPPGILYVRSDGNGAALRGWGQVLITVLRPNGKLVGPNALGLNWLSLGPPNLYCGTGDMGFGVSWDEEPVALPCQEGRWRIEVLSRGVRYGFGVVEVTEDRTSKLTIKLTENPPNPE